MSRSFLGFWPISGRVHLLKMKAKPFNISEIQCSVPVTAASDEDMEIFHEEMDKACAHCKSSKVCFVMGDFNPQVGNQTSATPVGPPDKAKLMNVGGLSETNARIMTWLFQVRSFKILCARNQIDHISIH